MTYDVGLIWWYESKIRAIHNSLCWGCWRCNEIRGVLSIKNILEYIQQESKLYSTIKLSTRLENCGVSEKQPRKQETWIYTILLLVQWCTNSENLSLQNSISVFCAAFSHGIIIIRGRQIEIVSTFGTFYVFLTGIKWRWFENFVIILFPVNTFPAKHCPWKWDGCRKYRHIFQFKHFPGHNITWHNIFREM